MISSVIVHKDGTVIVFDESGARISGYSGQWNDKMETIVRDAPYEATFHGVDVARCAICRKIIEGVYNRHMASKEHADNVRARSGEHHGRYLSKLMHIQRRVRNAG